MPRKRRCYKPSNIRLGKQVNPDFTLVREERDAARRCAALVSNEAVVTKTWLPNSRHAFYLIQAKRADGGFVNCAGNNQAVIALEIRQGRSCLNA